MDAGALYREGEAWRLREAEAGATVPDERAERHLEPGRPAGPGARQVLESAAVIGRLFRRRLLEEMWPESGAVVSNDKEAGFGALPELATGHGAPATLCGNWRNRG